MRLFASSNAQSAIPARLIRHWGLIGRGLKYVEARDSSGILNHIDNGVFDRWTAVQLPYADIFHGWNGMCLSGLRRAKQLGMATVVERASSHPSLQYQLLREEYQYWNVPLKLPMWNYSRSLREIEEADYVTVPSAFVRQSMIKAGVAEKKLLEIPFGVDLEQFLPGQQSTSHPFRLVFAGQVSIRKGVPYLLEAWRRLGWTDAELWIIGAVTPDFATLRDRWSQLPGVQSIAHSSNLPQLFQQSDVFVFPSIEEGSALVTYEALASGLPVVTTLNAGSIVRDGQEGFIVPIRNIEVLCSRLEQLRSNDQLRIQMARAARELVKQFTWEKYQFRLVSAYQHVLRSKASIVQ